MHVGLILIFQANRVSGYICAKGKELLGRRRHRRVGSTEMDLKRMSGRIQTEFIWIMTDTSGRQFEHNTGFLEIRKSRGIS
jgi:hypothetical protein